MHRNERLISNSLTLMADVSDITYEALEHVDGFARLIRFKLGGDEPRFGDTLLVTDGSEILFHGLVRAIDPAGWAMSMDLNSKLVWPRT